MKRKTHLYGDKKPISPYDAEDPDAKIILGRIWLSQIQKDMLKNTGKCYLTDKQQEVMDKFEGRKLSNFPTGWGAFIRPDLVWEYVYNEVSPDKL